MSQLVLALIILIGIAVIPVGLVYALTRVARKKYPEYCTETLVIDWIASKPILFAMSLTGILLGIAFDSWAYPLCAVLVGYALIYIWWKKNLP